MRSSVGIIFLGWCLTSCKWMTRGQSLPKPKLSISVSPNVVVPVGENITFRCESEERYLSAEFTLYKRKSSSLPKVETKKVERDEAVFHIIHAKPSDAGIFLCTFELNHLQWSDYSNEVDIMIKDPSLPKPLIQMKPKGQHGLGANVTIHCEGPENDLTFSLYKSVDMVASKTVKPNRNKTAFSIPRISLEDAGSYTCQYHSKGNSYVWSEPSMPVQLIVKDGSLSKPSIKVRSTERTPRGMNVTIECQGPEEDLNFSLFKFKVLKGLQTEQKRQIAEFHVFIKASEKPKEYTCQYHRKENPFVWSESSDPLKLNPRDRFPTTMWAGVAAGSLLVVLLLFFLIVLYRKKRKRSTANDGNQPVNMIRCFSYDKEP